MSLPLSTPTPAEDELKLQDMLQIMDVARTLRHERLTVEQQFSVEQTRQALRERLLASAKVSGSDVTPAEIDAAIELYFQNLHTYRDPPFGFRLLFAHLYIRRWLIGTILCFSGIIWGLIVFRG